MHFLQNLLRAAGVQQAVETRAITSQTEYMNPVSLTIMRLSKRWSPRMLYFTKSASKAESRALVAYSSDNTIFTARNCPAKQVGYFTQFITLQYDTC